MRVSVIIPVRDAERTLARAIDSVLRQEGVALEEVLVVDDGSRDASVEVAARYPHVRVLRTASAGAGPAAARNVGMRVATGELLAFNDADDAWLPGKLRRQVEVLAADAALDFCLCSFQNVADDGHTLAAWAVRERPGEVMQGFIFQAMVARRRVFDSLGILDESLVWGEDTDWFLRARDAGLAMRHLDFVGVHRYVHDRNLTGHVKESRAALGKVLMASLRRRRGGGA